MKVSPTQKECESFEAKLTGIDEDPAQLLSRSSSRIAAAARRYGSKLATKKRRVSDAQLRRLDLLEQCAQFFWMCCEIVEESPEIAVQRLDKEMLPSWNGPRKAAQNLFQMYQCRSYTDVLGACLNRMLDLAADRFMPNAFSIADFQCFLAVALRFPQHDYHFVNQTGDVVGVLPDNTPERIIGMIESLSKANNASTL